MNRLILLAGLILLLAIVSSSGANKNNDHHRKHSDESLTFVSREKRNMHRDRPYKRPPPKNVAARERRNKVDPVDEHALRAEADSLAAAIQSVAAGDNAANAAIEIEEERQMANHGQSSSVDEHSGYDAVRQSNNNEEQGSGNEGQGSSNEDLGQGQGSSEGQGQGGSKDKHESYGNNDENQLDTEEQTNEIAEEETIHQKTKTSHKHTSSSEEDSQSSQGLSSSDSEESSDTSVSKSNENGAALNKLMSQSSELAKQIRMVFDIMSKREKYLVDEMQKLQTSLAEAIKVLKSEGQGTSEITEGVSDESILRKRRDFNSEEPYRACVYIENAVENLNKGHGHHMVKRNIDEQSSPTQGNGKILPEALVKTQDESGHSYPDTSENLIESHPRNVESFKREGIDLSKVYWFKLPEENHMEAIHKKIQKILSGISASDRDVIFIPVTKSFTSKHEVANAFLSAFRFRRSIPRQK